MPAAPVTFDPKKRTGNTGVGGTPTGAPTTLGSPTAAPAHAPALSFEDAIKQYQASHAVSQASIDALPAYLKTQGYNVAFATHNGNTQKSNDFLVRDNGTGYDIAVGTDDPNNPFSGWSLSPSAYDSSRKVVNDKGEFVGYNDWTASLAAPGSAGTTLGTPAGNNVVGLGGSVTKAPLVGPNAPNYKGSGRAGTLGQQTENTLALNIGLAHVNAPAPVAPTPSLPDPTQAASDAYASAYAAANRARSRAQGGRGSTILGGFSGAPSTRMATLLGTA